MSAATRIALVACLAALVARGISPSIAGAASPEPSQHAPARRCEGGVWSLPVPDNAYRVTATFGVFNPGSGYFDAMQQVGALKAGATSVFHAGVDLGTPVGTPILAVFDGFVAAVDYSDAIGQYLVIQRDEEQARYGHLSSVFVEVGRPVHCGQIVGLTGATGKAISGAHLHFEARDRGTPFDALPRLESARTAQPASKESEAWLQPRVPDRPSGAQPAGMRLAQMGGVSGTVTGGTAPQTAPQPQPAPGMAEPGAGNTPAEALLAIALATFAITAAALVLQVKIVRALNSLRRDLAGARASESRPSDWSDADRRIQARGWQAAVAQLLADVTHRPVSISVDAALLDLSPNPVPHFAVSGSDGCRFVFTADAAGPGAQPHPAQPPWATDLAQRAVALSDVSLTANLQARCIWDELNRISNPSTATAVPSAAEWRLVIESTPAATGQDRSQRTPSLRALAAACLFSAARRMAR